MESWNMMFMAHHTLCMITVRKKRGKGDVTISHQSKVSAHLKGFKNVGEFQNVKTVQNPLIIYCFQFSFHTWLFFPATILVKFSFFKC